MSQFLWCEVKSERIERIHFAESLSLTALSILCFFLAVPPPTEPSTEPPTEQTTEPPTEQTTEQTTEPQPEPTTEPPPG